MNLPNKLTLIRVILVPFFLLFMYIDVPFSFAIALVIFAAASVTDALDGHIARKNNLVTNFGKFLDPLADKLMQVMALLCLFLSNFNKVVEAPIVPWWLLLPIVLKELTMGVGSVVFYRKFKTIGVAKNYGKAYTVLFYVVIAAVIVFDSWFRTHIWVKYILCALTAASGWAAIVLYYITYLKGTFKKGKTVSSN